MLFLTMFLTIVLATIFVLVLDRKSQWFGCYRPKYPKKKRDKSLRKNCKSKSGSSIFTVDVWSSGLFCSVQSQESETRSAH